MTQTNLVPPQTQVPDTVHVDSLDRETFLRDYVTAGRPLLIQGAMDDWKALEAWNDLAYLKSQAGERRVHATNVESGGHAQVSLADFWNNICTDGKDPHAYINAIVELRGKDGVLGNLKGDLGRAPFLDPADHISTHVFAGRDSRCGLHYHPATEAFMCQLVGPKRVLLFPPEASPKIYPVVWHSAHVTFSKAVFERTGEWPDLNEYPLMAETRPYEVTAQPGDMLYIPIFWWHVVFGMGTSVCAAMHYPATIRKRFFTRMGLRSNYINGKVIRYNWRLLTGGWKHRG